MKPSTHASDRSAPSTFVAMWDSATTRLLLFGLLLFGTLAFIGGHHQQAAFDGTPSGGVSRAASPTLATTIYSTESSTIPLRTTTSDSPDADTSSTTPPLPSPPGPPTIQFFHRLSRPPRTQRSGKSPSLKHVPLRAEVIVLPPILNISLGHDWHGAVAPISPAAWTPLLPVFRFPPAATVVPPIPAWSFGRPFQSPPFGVPAHLPVVAFPAPTGSVTLPPLHYHPLTVALPPSTVLTIFNHVSPLFTYPGYPPVPAEPDTPATVADAVNLLQLLPPLGVQRAPLAPLVRSKAPKKGWNDNVEPAYWPVVGAGAPTVWSEWEKVEHRAGGGDRGGREGVSVPRLWAEGGASVGAGAGGEGGQPGGAGGGGDYGRIVAPPRSKTLRMLAAIMMTAARFSILPPLASVRGRVPSEVYEVMRAAAAAYDGTRRSGDGGEEAGGAEGVAGGSAGRESCGLPWWELVAGGDRSDDHYVRLATVMAKASSGESVHIGVLGTSFTAGHGCASYGCTWQYIFTTLMAEVVSRGRATIPSKGRGGGGGGDVGSLHDDNASLDGGPTAPLAIVPPSFGHTVMTVEKVVAHMRKYYLPRPPWTDLNATAQYETVTRVPGDPVGTFRVPSDSMSCEVPQPLYFLRRGTNFSSDWRPPSTKIESCKPPVSIERWYGRGVAAVTTSLARRGARPPSWIPRLKWNLVDKFEDMGVKALDMVVAEWPSPNQGPRINLFALEAMDIHSALRYVVPHLPIVQITPGVDAGTATAELLAISKIFDAGHVAPYFVPLPPNSTYGDVIKRLAPGKEDPNMVSPFFPHLVHPPYRWHECYGAYVFGLLLNATLHTISRYGLDVWGALIDQVPTPRAVLPWHRAVVERTAFCPLRPDQISLQHFHWFAALQSLPRPGAEMLCTPFAAFGAEVMDKPGLQALVDDWWEAPNPQTLNPEGVWIWLNRVHESVGFTYIQGYTNRWAGATAIVTVHYHPLLPKLWTRKADIPRRPLLSDDVFKASHDSVGSFPELLELYKAVTVEPYEEQLHPCLIHSPMATISWSSKESLRRTPPQDLPPLLPCHPRTLAALKKLDGGKDYVAAQIGILNSTNPSTMTTEASVSFRVPSTIPSGSAVCVSLKTYSSFKLHSAQTC